MKKIPSPVLWIIAFAVLILAAFKGPEIFRTITRTILFLLPIGGIWVSYIFITTGDLKGAILVGGFLGILEVIALIFGVIDILLGVSEFIGTIMQIISVPAILGLLLVLIVPRINIRK